jgi:hypothetical protein
MAETFEFRYGAFRVLLIVLGMGPRFSRVVLDDRRVRVRMGWAFRSSIPRASITGAERREGPVGGIGVHGRVAGGNRTPRLPQNRT